MQSQKQSSSNILSFPSFIGDFEGLKINLNDELIKHPEATFYARVRGHPIKDAGIQDGDLLVIDKAQEPIDGYVAVCAIDGEFTLTRLAVEKDGIYLMPANDEFKPIKITEENDFLSVGCCCLCGAQGAITTTGDTFHIYSLFNCV